MDKAFEKQIGRNVKVYIDNIIFKTKNEDSFIKDIAEVFKQLRKYILRLTPGKCVFGMQERKFLRCMVSERGIYVNPTKIKVLLETQTPSSVKDVQ